jgi:hypothetical protein
MTMLTCSCSNSNVPNGILSDKEITPVLVELHLAESIYTQRNSLEITRENYQEDLYVTILKKYKLDQKVFETSVLYYGKHPDKYKPIYDEVLNRLHEMEVKTRIKDSIEARKPVVKDVSKDTTQTKKTEANVKSNDSIKLLDIKTSTKNALKSQKTDTKVKANEAVQVKKPDVKQMGKDTAKVIK